MSYDGFYDQEDFDQEFTRLTQAEWSPQEEQDAEIEQATDTIADLTAERNDFAEIINPEWSWQTLADAQIAQQAEAAAFLAEAAYLRSRP